MSREVRNDFVQSRSASLDNFRHAKSAGPNRFANEGGVAEGTITPNLAEITRRHSLVTSSTPHEVTRRGSVRPQASPKNDGLKSEERFGTARLFVQTNFV